MPRKRVTTHPHAHRVRARPSAVFGWLDHYSGSYTTTPGRPEADAAPPIIPALMAEFQISRRSAFRFLGAWRQRQVAMASARLGVPVDPRLESLARAIASQYKPGPVAGTGGGAQIARRPPLATHINQDIVVNLESVLRSLTQPDVRSRLAAALGHPDGGRTTTAPAGEGGQRMTTDSLWQTIEECLDALDSLGSQVQPVLQAVRTARRST